VLSYDAGGNGNPEDCIVGLGLPDVDAAVAQARQYLRLVGYPPLAGRRHDHRCCWNRRFCVMAVAGPGRCL
jgi:hypothetical protein